MSCVCYHFALLNKNKGLKYKENSNNLGENHFPMQDLPVEKIPAGAEDIEFSKKDDNKADH